jgi:hypothetical protein
MNRQDGKRLRRSTGRAPVGGRGRTVRAGPDEKVAEPLAPHLDGTLPAGYGETRIVLLPVDPYLVHVYWEVSLSGKRFVRALVEAGALRPQAVLRFHDVTAMPAGGVRAEGSFDVAVDMESRNWYVRLLSPEKAYVVDLGFRAADGRFHRVARSNRGETPRAWPCAEAGEQRMRVVEVDGSLHADPVEEPEFAPGFEALSEVSGVSEVKGHKPRVEIPQEEKRAVAGVAGGPAVTVEAGRAHETGSFLRPSESHGIQEELRAARKEGGADRAERIRPIGVVQAGKPPAPSNPRPVHGREDFRPKPKVEAVHEPREGLPPEEKGAGRREPPEREEQGPVETDLSLFCDRLFVSGVSSSRVSTKGGKDDQNDG